MARVKRSPVLIEMRSTTSLGRLRMKVHSSDAGRLEEERLLDLLRQRMSELNQINSARSVWCFECGGEGIH